MEFLVCVAIAIATLFSSVSFAEVDPVDIVFDIDDTFAFRASQLPPSESILIVRAGEREFAIPKAFIQSVETLLQLGETGVPIRISFYSGGVADRNRALLSALRLSDGRTLLDVAHKVLNRDDLFDPTVQRDAADKRIDPESFQPKEHIFRGQSKKDLLKINSNLSRVIFVDDERGYALAGQEKNHLAVLWSVYDEPEGVGPEWKRITGLITETIRDVAKGKSVPDALYARQFESGTWDYRQNYQRYERAGAVAIKAAEEKRMMCPKWFAKLTNSAQSH